MKTLDEDAEILKQRAQKTSTGRKTSTSGLGAFKILRKYDNLVEKHRDASPPKENVPQLDRGTSTFDSEAKMTSKSKEAVDVMPPTQNASLHGSPPALESEVTSKSKPFENDIEVSLASNSNQAKIDSEDKLTSKSNTIDIEVKPTLPEQKTETKSETTIVQASELRTESTNISERKKRIRSQFDSEASLTSKSTVGETTAKLSNTNPSDEFEVTLTPNSNQVLDNGKGCDLSDGDFEVIMSSKSRPGEQSNEPQGKKGIAVDIEYNLTPKSSDPAALPNVDPIQLSTNQSSNEPLFDKPLLEVSEVIHKGPAKGAKDITNPILSVEPLDPLIEQNESAKSTRTNNALNIDTEVQKQAPVQNQSSSNDVESIPLRDLSHQVVRQSESDLASTSMSIRTHFDVNSNSNHGDFEVKSARLRSHSGVTSESAPVSASKSNFPRNPPVYTKQISQKSAEQLVLEMSELETKIFDFIFRRCANLRSLQTERIFRKEIQAETGIGVPSIKTAIQRLKKDNLLSIVEFKPSTNGWTIYSIPESIYETYSSLEHVIRKTITSESAPVSASDSKRSSQVDSIININSNLTNDLTSKSNLPNWFGRLNFSNVPVQPSQVNPSIRQLVLLNLAPEDVQNFIDRFTSWAAAQKRINNYVGMFCEKLKAYAVDGDSDVLLAMTEQDRRQEAEFSAQIEKARQEMELIEKARRHEIEKNASEQFESWYETANDEEIQIVLKPSSLMPFRSEIYKRSLRQVYFEKHNL